METKSHILAIVQVFEDHIDLNSNALMKEVEQSYLRKDDNADNSFFEDFSILSFTSLAY